MRYDRQYYALARKAASQGGVDIQAFIDLAVNNGVSRERIHQMIIEDIETGGPIFGRFIRDLGGAAESSVVAAKHQGEMAARAYHEGLIELAEMDDVTDIADPEALQRIEDDTADLIDVTWVTTSSNVCHLCLPLHGVTKSIEEWRELNLIPGQVHFVEGWKSSCKCKWIRPDQFDRRKEMPPLRRVKDRTATGLKGDKRTVRGIASSDLLESLAARDKAMQSERGRRQLRLLGQSMPTRPRDEGEIPSD